MLVVEDETEVAALFRDLLLQLGYEPVLAGSAEAARVELETERPDVILLDVHLPGRSGIDFLKLRQIHESGIPVVAVSGVATESEVRECLRLGAIDVIEKPVGMALLRAVLFYAEVRGRRKRAGVDRRRSPRSPIAIPVQVVEYSGTEWQGICVDVSTFGMKVRPENPVSPEPAAKLVFTPPENEAPLALLSLFLRQDGDTCVFRFARLTRGEFMRLTDLVERLTAERS